MSSALWKLTWRESRRLWIALAVLMFAFHWVYVWIVSQMNLTNLENFMNGMPDVWKRMLPVQISQAVSLEGRLAFGYEHPLVAYGCVVWAITRGSDAVSGPLSRGTLELVLAQPVRRSQVLFVNAAQTALGAFALAFLCWLGTVIGVLTVPAFAKISPLPYVATAANLFALTFFLAGFTTLLSAADRHRWRTIGLSTAAYVVAIMFKVISRAAPNFAWLKYCSFLTPFEPQSLIAEMSDVWENSLKYDGILLLLGTVAYLAAWKIFHNRDLPAPL